MQLPKKDAQNLAKIINALKTSPGGLWIREICRQTHLHFETVRRLLDRYSFLFDEYADFTQYRINLKIVRLKHDIDASRLEKLVRIARSLGLDIK
jgi:DNA-binding IclR family transcriptional regulator